MRVKGGPKGKNRRSKILKATEGFQGRARNAFRIASRALDRAMAYNYRDRKNLKRNMRQLWITRITAAVRARGLSYSKFMGSLKAQNIDINRKMLADLAATNPHSFDEVIKAASVK